LRLSSDKRTEGTETITLKLNAIIPGSGLADNSSASMSVLDTSILPTMSLSNAQSAIDEGDTARFVVTTTGLTAGTSLSYTVSGVNSADILGELTGNAVLDAQGRASINVASIADNTTEGTENLILTLRYADSMAPLSATLSVSIRDTSLTPIPPVLPPTEIVIPKNVWLPTAGADVFTWAPTNLALQLNGMGGTDKLVVNGSLNDFAISANTSVSSSNKPLMAPLNASATLTQSNSISSVKLQNIERLQFSDFNLALDTLATNAPGKAALIAGAVFGPASARDTQAVGALLSMLDAPSATDLQVANFALKLMLGNNPSYKSVVDMLYQNLTGVYPNAVEEANYVRLLDAGFYSPGSLALFAANHELNKTKIGFVGIVENGLIYQAVA
jgi:hypothetical protein